jgi:Sec-independent protein translocase protein TatA
MGMTSIAHWGLLLVAVFLLLGKGKFSAAMSDMGQGLRNLREGLTEDAPQTAPDQTEDMAKPLTKPSSPISHISPQI